MIAEQDLETLEAMHRVREEALGQCRLIIQNSSKAIRCVHRGEFQKGEDWVKAATDVAQTLRAKLEPYPQIQYAGYFLDAEKERAEAAIFLAVIQGQEVPTAGSLGIEVTSYLHGLGEAASEARRSLLDGLREGKFEQARTLMNWMGEVCDFLSTVDYPDGLTGGLRRTTDALRAVVERTRSDLTLTQIQLDLLNELQAKK